MLKTVHSSPCMNVLIQFKAVRCSHFNISCIKTKLRHIFGVKEKGQDRTNKNGALSVIEFITQRENLRYARSL